MCTCGPRMPGGPRGPGGPVILGITFISSSRASARCITDFMSCASCAWNCSIFCMLISSPFLILRSVVSRARPCTRTCVCMCVFVCLGVCVCISAPVRAPRAQPWRTRRQAASPARRSALPPSHVSWTCAASPTPCGRLPAARPFRPEEPVCVCVCVCVHII